MVARTHSAPSSRWGMNSPPMNGTNKRLTPKIIVATNIVSHGRSRHHFSSEPYSFLIHSKGLLRGSRTPFLNQYEHITGTKVRVRISAPIRATDMVSAIGWNNFPDGPLSA